MLLYLNAFRRAIINNKVGITIYPGSIQFDSIEQNGETVLVSFGFESKYYGEAYSVVLRHKGQFYVLAENWANYPATIHSCYKYEWIDEEGNRIRFPKWFEDAQL